MEFLTLIAGAAVLIWLLAQLNFYMGHSDEHKRTLRLQVLFGLPILVFGSWAYCISDWSNLGALYLYGCYCCLCMVYNGFHNLLTKSGESQDFSEYFLFGWFKSDNFVNEIVVGAVGCYFCFQGFVTGSGTIYKTALVESPKPVAHYAHVASSHATSRPHVHAHVASHATGHSKNLHH